MLAENSNTNVIHLQHQAEIKNAQRSLFHSKHGSSALPDHNSTLIFSSLAVCQPSLLFHNVITYNHVPDSLSPPAYPICTPLLLDPWMSKNTTCCWLARSVLWGSAQLIKHLTFYISSQSAWGIPDRLYWTVTKHLSTFFVFWHDCHTEILQVIKLISTLVPRNTKCIFKFKWKMLSNPTCPDLKKRNKERNVLSHSKSTDYVSEVKRNWIN